MISLESLRSNPALLKLDLYCKGVAAGRFLLHRGGRRAQDPAHPRRPRQRARARSCPAGCGPTSRSPSRSRQRSPYILHREKRASTGSAATASRVVAGRALAAARTGTTRTTATGKPMTRIGTLQGTYLGIYQAKVCEYWTEKPQKVNCKFCSVGLNLGRRRRRREVGRRGDGGRARGARASRASPTSTSTPATTRATPTSTSSSPTSCASRRSSAC